MNVSGRPHPVSPTNLKRANLLLLGTLVVLVFAWSVSGIFESGEGLEGTRGPGNGLSNEPDSIGPATLIEGAESDEASTAAGQGASDGGAERQEVLEEGFDLDRALWVEGRVRILPGTPRDEEAWVVATRVPDQAGPMGLGEEVGEDRPAVLSRARAASDGQFRLALPDGTVDIHLSVHGRYSYSSESVQHVIGDEDPLELAVRLGAWIQGTLSTGQEGAKSEGSLEGVEARLVVDPTGSANVFDGSAWAIRSAPAPKGRFEFRGVSTDYLLRVFALSEVLPAATSEQLQLKPGEHIELSLNTEVGGSLKGRVIDEAGEPFVGATVFALQDANFLAGRLGRRVRETTTDESGQFELSGVATGALSVRAEFEGHLQVSERVDLDPGELIEGIELQLTRGRSMTGRVLGPDGEPRARAKLFAMFDLSTVGGMDGIYAIRGSFQEALTDEEGKFVISGLGRGPFNLSASWVSPEHGDDPTDRSVAQWAETAKLDRVQAPAKDLEIRLTQSFSIRGRVFDELGEAVSTFNVQASRGSDSLVAGFGTEIVQEDVESSEGTFELWGLPQGVWNVAVTAPGYAPCVVSDLSVPAEPNSPPSEFALLPELFVAGRVLLPDGSPAQGAQVSNASNDFERMSDAFHALESDASVSDGRGNYRLGGLGPGRIFLVANFKGYADSLPVELDLLAGTPIDNVTLKLRAGCVVTGEVYGDDGLPAVGDGVFAQIPGGLDLLQTSSDPNGRFRFEDMIPGKWQIAAMPNEDRMASLISEKDGGIGRMLSGLRIQIIDLKEGDEKHVLLGEPLPNPVRVFGEITIDGDAVPGVVVSFVADGGQEGSVRFGSADAAGHYELSLPAAGSYVMMVQRMGQVMAETSLEFRVEIPEREEHEHDVQIPLGRISGKVIGPSGDPLASARVSLVGEGNADRTFWGGQFTDIATDANGEYEIDWLRAGSYRVTAGGLRFGGLMGEPSPWGRGEGRVVSVSEGEHLEGVDFRLKRGGAIAGVVRDDLGVPVPDAAVYVYDEGGRPVERLSFERTDTSGAYNVRSLGPGEYSVMARGAFSAGELSELVLVESDKTAEMDLQLVASTLLEVEVQGPDGQTLSADVRVLDSEGRNLGGVVSFEQIIQAFQSGSAQTLQRVGPLAPGRYRVEASVPGIGSADKKVTLRGKPSRRVVLRLK